MDQYGNTYLLPVQRNLLRTHVQGISPYIRNEPSDDADRPKDGEKITEDDNRLVRNGRNKEWGGYKRRYDAELCRDLYFSIPKQGRKNRKAYADASEAENKIIPMQERIGYRMPHE